MQSFPAGTSFPLARLGPALLALLSGLWLPVPTAAAPPMNADELERWFNDDSEQRALAVNEGELVFLTEPPAKPVPHSHNTLTITPASIDDGWVALAQCYDGLDPVAEAQVVYRYKQMRDLRVTAVQHIGRTWVEGDSVQLEDVGHDAELDAGHEDQQRTEPDQLQLVEARDEPAISRGTDHDRDTGAGEDETVLPDRVAINLDDHRCRHGNDRHEAGR